jgi:hypothetical protein
MLIQDEFYSGFSRESRRHRRLNGKRKIALSMSGGLGATPPTSREVNALPPACKDNHHMLISFVRVVFYGYGYQHRPSIFMCGL